MLRATFHSQFILILKQLLQQILVLIQNRKKKFVVSYVMIVAFHPQLKLNRIMIQRSYAHSIEQLTSLNYFTQERIKFLDNDLTKMLEDIAFDVSKRKCKNTMGQMFCIESALVKKTLLRWFNTKYKQQFVKMAPFTKIRFEKENSINWKTQTCVICRCR